MHKRLEELMRQWQVKGLANMTQAELIEFRQVLEQSKVVKGSRKEGKRKSKKLDKLIEELSKGMKKSGTSNP